jgi:hypothetical protein
MARNGSGTYSLPAGNPVTGGTTISSTWANNTLSDIGTALTGSLAKDGQTVPTNNLPMGGFKLTGLAAGSANGESVRFEQLPTLASLGAAASGANTDITSLASPNINAATATTQAAGDNSTKVATTAFVQAATPQIQPISASVNASALTITASALSLDFRSTTLGSGTVTRVTGTPASLVVPSGATLGTVSATQSRLAVLALNNAGTVELAAVNIAGGNDLTETGLISTTAISAAATSAAVVYSTTARTSVAYRVIGYVESTQATAGTWATAPSTIQGYGGQALAAMSSMGYGQTWQNVTGSRVIGTTYYNTTGRPISISVGCNTTGTGTTSISINGGAALTGTTASATFPTALFAIIPPGQSYVVSCTNYTTTQNWSELR